MAEFVPADGTYRDPETTWVTTVSGEETGAEYDGLILKDGKTDGSVDTISAFSARLALNEELAECPHCQSPLVLFTPEAFIVNARALDLDMGSGFEGEVLALADSVRDSGTLSAGVYCEQCHFADTFTAEMFDSHPHVFWSSLG